MFGRWAREARLSLARLPSSVPGIARAPDRPVHAIRDVWPGDPEHGASLVGGACFFEWQSIPLRAFDWEYTDLAPESRAYLQGFTWLRDLRALGNDEARLYARGIVGSWLDQPPTDPLVLNAPATGARLASWLGHFDFFAASANEAFRQRLMDRILVEGRLISIMLPLPEQGWQNFTALKGLLAVAVAIPSQSGFLHRFHRALSQEIARQILPDGTLRERSPLVQKEVARELTEISVIMRMAHLPSSELVQNALSKVCPVLRALRHADGGLALFNGGKEQDGCQVDRIIQYGARQRLLASAMPDGGFWRLTAGKALVFLDGAVPPPAGYDQHSHAAPLSIEFSSGRQRLFVNCGAASTGAWRQALRETAAHSSLVVEKTSCCDFSPDGHLLRRPAHVTVTHQTQDGAHWIDGQHDGYHSAFGVTLRRSLYLGPTGEDLRGEDSLEGERQVGFALRFHLHPSVEAELGPDEDEVLMRAGGMIWRFRQYGGALSLEKSVYAGGRKPVPSSQIVIRPFSEPASDQSEATGGQDGAQLGSYANTHTPIDADVSEAEANSNHEARSGFVATIATQSGAQTSSSLPQTRQVIQWVMERVPE